MSNKIIFTIDLRLLCSVVLVYFTWNKSSKTWKSRKRGVAPSAYARIFTANTLDRLYTIRPKQRESFYLRLLFINTYVDQRHTNIRERLIMVKIIRDK